MLRGQMTSGPAPDPSRLADLRAEAVHCRQRLDLYRAKSYGPRTTSPARLRELERAAAAADARLATALRRDGRY